MDAERLPSELWWLSEIRVQASRAFQETVVSIMEREKEVCGEEFAPYIIEFNRLAVQSLAKHLLALT